MSNWNFYYIIGEKLLIDVVYHKFHLSLSSLGSAASILVWIDRSKFVVILYAYL